MRQIDLIAAVALAMAACTPRADAQTPGKPPPTTNRLPAQRLDPAPVPPVAAAVGAGVLDKGPRAPDELPTVTDLPIRQQVMAYLNSSPTMPGRATQARRALEETLRMPPTFTGVTPVSVTCTGLGCMADVVYPTRQAFEVVDLKRMASRESPFNKWPYSNGRTGLFRRGNQMVASWYFLMPPPDNEYRPDRTAAPRPAKGGGQ
jgi:hypothetical protein